MSGSSGQMPIHRYPNGDSYRPAAGRCRQAGRDSGSFTDTRDWHRAMAVVDLDAEHPDPQWFVRVVVREMRIRCYSRNSVKAYRCAIESFLRWAGCMPHAITREHVRQYLEYLVDSERGAAHLSGHLSAIRTCFDKFCFRDITLGLASPRKPKRLPIVLSQDEVRRLLEAAASLRDKLLLGLMYATGMRVGEVVAIRWANIDTDRNLILVQAGKGNADRYVMLPESYRPLFRALVPATRDQRFVFPAESVERRSSNPQRHLSPRTAQRIMKRTVRIAKITKPATPHALRHSFATHSFENGCDIRRIQKILGHVHLETTTIYVRVAQPAGPAQMPSPLDRLENPLGEASSHRSVCGAGVSRREDVGNRPAQKPVGVMKIHHRQLTGEPFTRVTIAVLQPTGPVFLTGTEVLETRPGYWTFKLPPLEAWGEAMRRLPEAQRLRLQEPEFYEQLQAVILQRLAACPRLDVAVAAALV